MTRAPTDIAASVHARLLQRAKAEGRPFDELLQYFAMERLLYRLSRSPHADRFVLKGAAYATFLGHTALCIAKDMLRRLIMVASRPSPLALRPSSNSQPPPTLQRAAVAPN